MRHMLDEMEIGKNVIIVMGYKYGDDHINEILFKALENPNNIWKKACKHGQNTNIPEGGQRIVRKRWSAWFFSEKSTKKSLTKAFRFDILCKLAYGIPRKSGPANLENDTEKKRANIKEKN